MKNKMKNITNKEMTEYIMNLETYLLDIARKKDSSCLTCDINGNPLNIGDKVYDRLKTKIIAYIIVDGTETTMQVDNENKDWLHIACVEKA